jgi:hypothetical protein
LVVGLLIGMHAGPAFCDEGKDQPPPKPPELKVLEELAGTWDTKATIKVSEWTPKEVRTTGTITTQWVLGGRFLQGTGSDSSKNEFIGTWTYDPQRKAYRFWFFDSAGTAMEWSGSWDDDAKELSLKQDMGNGITSTLTTRVVDKNTIAWHSEAKGKDGKLYHGMEGTWVRKK